MTLFLGLGIAGLALLVLTLLLDGALHGLFPNAFGGLVSLPTLAGFMSMLGFGGAIVLGTTGLGTAVAIAIGAGAGLFTAAAVLRLSRVLMRDQTSSTPRRDDLVGTAGVVVTPIAAGGGYGEVMLRVAGLPVKYAARSSDPVPIGTEVWVTAELSSTSVEVRAVQR